MAAVRAVSVPMATRVPQTADQSTVALTVAETGVWLAGRRTLTTGEAIDRTQLRHLRDNVLYNVGTMCVLRREGVG